MRSRVLVLVGLLACRRERPAPVEIAAAPPPDAAPPPANRFVGAAACKACHDKKVARFAHDWHLRALSPATRATVAGKFDGAHFRGASSEAWMTSAGGGYAMRTAGPAGAVADFPVSWVIGGKRMQDAV